MMNRRRALIAALGAEDLYFEKAAGEYILTNVNARLDSSSITKRLIILDLAYLGGTDTWPWLFGVGSSTKVGRNRLGCYLSTTNKYATMLWHTGNAGSSTAYVPEVTFADGIRHEIKIQLQFSSAGYSNIIVDNNTKSFNFTSFDNGYTASRYFALGGIHNVTVTDTYWSANIYRFAIYDGVTTENPNALVYELVPRKDNGIVKPYETVSGQFATWLTNS